MFKGSWKTTALGVATLLSVISNAVVALLDGNPATNVDWSAAWPALTAGFGLIVARDNDKSSEQAGAK